MLLTVLHRFDGKADEGGKEGKARVLEVTALAFGTLQISYQAGVVRPNIAVELSRYFEANRLVGIEGERDIFCFASQALVDRYVFDAIGKKSSVANASVQEVVVLALVASPGVVVEDIALSHLVQLRGVDVGLYALSLNQQEFRLAFLASHLVDCVLHVIEQTVLDELVGGGFLSGCQRVVLDTEFLLQVLLFEDRHISSGAFEATTGFELHQKLVRLYLIRIECLVVEGIEHAVFLAVLQLHLITVPIISQNIPLQTLFAVESRVRAYSC